jgi:hypothetical protein
VIRTRRILAACLTTAAVFLATAAVAGAYMPMPPIKIPTPGHHAYPVLTKDELLAAGGSCFFGGGFCTDKNGNGYDCSTPSNCVPIDSRR